MTVTAAPLAPGRGETQLAVLRLAVAEVDALAAFARDLGYTVVAEPRGHTSHRFIVTAPNGKEAVLTLAGHDIPVATVMWAHPFRSSAMPPRATLLSMRFATSNPDRGSLS